MWTRRIDFTSALAGGELDPLTHRTAEVEAFKEQRSRELDALRASFLTRDGSGLLGRAEFCQVIRKYCRELENLSNDDLSAVFFNIDGDNDGRVSWEDMYTYALDTAKQRLLTRPAENIRPYSFSRWVRRADNVVYVRYFDSLDRIVVSSRHHPLQLMNPSTLRVEFDLKPSDMSLSSCQVKLVEHMPSFNVIAAYCDDLRLRLWSFAERKFVQLHTSQCETALSQLRCVQNDEKTSLLFASTRTGSLQCFDISRLNEARLRETWDLRLPVPSSPLQERSVDFITDFCFQTPSTSRVIAASLDRTLSITDLATKPSKTTLIGDCETAIVKLGFAEAQQCIAAVHVDNQISTWVTYSSLNPRTDLVDLSKPHRGKIVGLHCPTVSPQIITVDSTGFVKIWDLRMFQCAQSFVVGSSEDVSEDTTIAVHSSRDFFEGERPHVNSSCCITSTGELICATTAGLVCHQYDKGADPTLADSHMIVGIGYNASANAFVTVSAHDMNIWDAEEGVLLSSYRKLTKSDISTMCVDNKGRRVFLGMHDGHIEMRSFHGGSLIKKIQIHESEVTAIEYCDAIHCFLTASTDGSFCVYNETDSTNPVSRNKFSSSPLLCLAVSSVLGLILTGNAKGKAVLTELGRSRQIIGECVGESQVRAVLFLGRFPAFAAAYFNGNIIIWSCRPALDVVRLHGFSINASSPSMPLHPSAKEVHHHGDLNDPSGIDLFSFSPTSMQFDTESHVLWIGDSSGQITGWTMCPILQHYHLKHGSYPATPMFSVEAPPVDQSYVSAELRVTFKAHSEEVTCLQLIQTFGLLVSAGDDRRVCLWSFKGEKSGELSMGRLPEGTEDPNGPTARRLHSKFHSRESRSREQYSQMRRVANVAAHFRLLKSESGKAVQLHDVDNVQCHHKIRTPIVPTCPGIPSTLERLASMNMKMGETRYVSPRGSFTSGRNEDATQTPTPRAASVPSPKSALKVRMKRLPCAELSAGQYTALEQHVKTLIALSDPSRQRTRLSTASASPVEVATPVSQRSDAEIPPSLSKQQPDRDTNLPAPSSDNFDSSISRSAKVGSRKKRRKQDLSSIDVVNLSISKLQDLNELHRQARQKEPYSARLHVARLVDSRESLTVTTRASYNPTPPSRPWTSGGPAVVPEGETLLQQLRTPRERIASARPVPHSTSQLCRGVVPLGYRGPPRPPQKRDQREVRLASYAAELHRCLGWAEEDMRERCHSGVEPRSWSTNRLRSELFKNACAVALATPKEDTL